MRVLSLIIKAVLFLLLLVFAVKNSESVTVRYLMGLEWHAPLSLVMLLAFAAGTLSGLLGCTRKVVQNRRELARLRKTSQTGNP